MNELNSLYTLFDKLGLLTDFYDTYGPILLKAALVFALLNCFFGYKLRKLWSCIFGLLLGIGTGLAAAVYLDQPVKFALIAAAAAGLLFMALAFLLYRIGMFFLCIGAVIMTLFQLFPLPTFSAICGFVVFGLVVGFLSVIKEHTIVICITSICGGVGSAKLIFLLLANDNTFLTILLSVILSALGLVFQFKPWKDKEYWKEEADKSTQQRKGEKDRRKSRRQKRRSRKKTSSKASSKKTSSKKRSSSPNSAPERQRPSSRSSAQERQPPSASYGNNSPSRNAPQSTPNSRQPDSASVPRPTTPAVPAESPKAAEPDSYTVDLSDVRSEISKEVQSIYEETQK